MEIGFTKFTESLSDALDYAEKALLNVEPMHGMRVAVMTNKMAAQMGLDEEIIFSLTQAAMLHDCALSEYLKDEMIESKIEAEEKPEAEGKTKKAVSEMDMAEHCVVGEEILLKMPFYEKIKGAVLHHHDRADGKGALRRKADETPIYGQLIHMADAADVNFHLYTIDEKKYENLCAWVKDNAGTVFAGECADAFLKSVDYKTLQDIAGENCKKTFEAILPNRIIDVSTQTLREMSSVFADITDYKSHFTWRHSMGIAQKAEEMGRYYKLSEEECDKLFVAGALHDIGKLITDNVILDKPGKLTPEEYKEIQYHAMGTWDMLKNIEGIEDITKWAAYHHEKLDGSGYPFELTGDKLDKNSRLMACLDIYQALVEDRPYKAGMPHEEAMGILRKMGDAGQLDNQIIDDIDSCFGVNR